MAVTFVAYVELLNSRDLSRNTSLCPRTALKTVKNSEKLFFLVKIYTVFYLSAILEEL